VNILSATRKELVPAYTRLYQVDDGTIFYCKYSPPMRLYVKWEGKEIDGQLPDGQLKQRSTKNGQTDLAIVACGNYLFFLSADK
ncbi:hypothetical protein PMAYCL1PPCAC_08950, partial [Pristionchus mayeri]